MNSRTNAERQRDYRSRLRQQKINATIKTIQKLERQLRRLYKTQGKT